MANRSASVSRKITYAHIPKDGADGKTPVYDSTSNKWTYADKPTASQLTLSANRLIDLDAKSVSANTQAMTALAAADVAKQTADSKSSVSDVVDSLFPAYDEFGNPVVMDTLQFQYFDDGWQITFCFKDSKGIMMCAVLGYAKSSDLAKANTRISDLESRVKELEKRLGIS